MTIPADATAAPAGPASIEPYDPAAVYRARRDHFSVERDVAGGRWSQLANARLAVFITALALTIWGIAGLQATVWAWTAALGGVIMLGGFVALVVTQRRLGRRRQRAAALAGINAEALRRLARDWDALPLRHNITAAPGHPYAGDLDITGRASLFHLLDTTSTPLGAAALAGWLLRPSSDATKRQGAVVELAPRLDFRQEMALRGRDLGEGAPGPEPFLTWAESPPILINRPLALWAARINVALLWLSIVAQAAGLIGAPLWLIFAAGNLILLQAIIPRAHAPIAWAFLHERSFRGYADLFGAVSAASFDDPALRRIQSELTAGGIRADAQMARLQRRIAFSIPRSAQLYWPIQALTLWDAHLLAALEHWKREAGEHVRGWLAALAEVEALAALAGLAYDHPAWAFPEVAPDAASLDARALGHPLLPGGVRVANDVTVGPPGTFLLVTGSNMSGKSTLLRAIGVNVVLANAGAPVCAASLRMPPLTLWTSMRVSDSLERGVSYFMAELERLKAVVDAARRNAENGGGAFLYLLDEILQGTNTAERQIAARRIIATLIDLGAIGAVSTHDLTLAADGRLARTAGPVHFRETIASVEGAPAMSFDYRLRPGIATSRNALRLMEIIGLDVAGEE